MGSRSGRAAGAPWRVALTVLAFQLAWIVIYLATPGHDIRDFIKIGPSTVRSSHASSVIRYDPTYRYIVPRDQSSGDGYDGQFSYYIALDPARAHDYIHSPDSAPYRYERILYPVLARFAALEQPAAVPWTLLAINVLACVGGVLALAAWLGRRGASPWVGALYGVYPGMLIALQFDLTEPLAYGLVALAIYLFDFGGRHGVLKSGVAFALAALTREMTLVFTVLFGLSMLAGRPNASWPEGARAPLRGAVAFLALAIVPFAAWIAVDYSWLGVPTSSVSILDPVPFRGLFADPFALTRQPLELAFVGLPALLFAVAMTGGLRASEGRLERLCVIVNAAVIVVFASGAVWGSYTSIGRVSIAIVLGAVLCVPYLSLADLVPIRVRRPGPPRAAHAALLAAALWMAMLPGAMYYAFSQKRLVPRQGAVAATGSQDGPPALASWSPVSRFTCRQPSQGRVNA